MQKSCLYIALIFFIPLLAYVAARGRAYEQYRDFYCKSDISEITVYGKNGNPERLKGMLAFDLKNNEINMSFYDVSTTLPRWRGIIKIEQEYDFWGALKSIKTINVTPSISSGNIQSIKENMPPTNIFRKEVDIPLRFYKIKNSEGVYFFKYANHIGFCINEY